MPRSRGSSRIAASWRAVLGATAIASLWGTRWDASRCLEGSSTCLCMSSAAIWTCRGCRAGLSVHRSVSRYRPGAKRRPTSICPAGRADTRSRPTIVPASRLGHRAGRSRSCQARRNINCKSVRALRPGLLQRLQVLEHDLRVSLRIDLRVVLHDLAVRIDDEGLATGELHAEQAPEHSIIPSGLLAGIS